MPEYPSAECKSVEFHPCDSRVGKLAVICDADTFPFIITKFISVVTFIYLCGIQLFILSLNSYRIIIYSCSS
jgi:hypothetical protein